MAAGGNVNRPIGITTPLGPDALLLSAFSGHEAISQLFAYRVDLVAANTQQVPFEALLGQPVTVALSLASGGSRYFSGIVQRFSQGARDRKLTSHSADVVPSLWLLTRSQTSRIFQQLSVPDILRGLFSSFSTDFQLQGTYQPRNYCVQYRETDFAFASRLMEEEGIFYFFKHTSDGHQLVVGDTPRSHVDVPGPIAFDPTGANRNNSEVVFQWEKCQELRSGLVTLRDHTFELPDETLEVQAASLDAVTAGTATHRLKLPVNQGLELYDFPGGYAQRFDGIDSGGGDQPDELGKILPDGMRTVGIRMQQETLPSLTIAGAGTARSLAAGQAFTLLGHFNGDGRYVLESVEHSAQLKNVVDGTGLTYTSLFRCIPDGLPFRPSRTTPRPIVSGHQTAVVVGPAGEEIYTDKYGRVKVQFFWDREGKKDERSSCWIRVAHPAQPPGTAVEPPQIGQEVVVDFEEGDPDRPIVVPTVDGARRPPP
jgi:type VI secretion system secreted protein VgrG